MVAKVDQVEVSEPKSWQPPRKIELALKDGSEANWK